MNRQTKELFEGVNLSCGVDGYWLHFETGSGSCAMIHLDVVSKGGIINEVIMQWAKEAMENKDEVKK